MDSRVGWWLRVLAIPMTGIELGIFRVPTLLLNRSATLTRQVPVYSCCKYPRTQFEGKSAKFKQLNQQIFKKLWKEDLLVDIFRFTQGIFDVYCKGKDLSYSHCAGLLRESNGAFKREYFCSARTCYRFSH